MHSSEGVKRRLNFVFVMQMLLGSVTKQRFKGSFTFGGRVRIVRNVQPTRFRQKRCFNRVTVFLLRVRWPRWYVTVVRQRGFLINDLHRNSAGAHALIWRETLPGIKCVQSVILTFLCPTLPGIKCVQSVILTFICPVLFLILYYSDMLPNSCK